MSDLAEFVLARIADREAVAVDMQHQASMGRPFFDLDRLAGGTGIRELIDPARVLAECEAKRRIVELHHPSPEYDSPACVLCQWDVDCDGPVHDYQFEEGRRTEWPCETIMALASVYAAHPDYRPEWRP